MHLSDRWWRKSSYLFLVLSILVPASEGQSPTALPGSHLAPKLTISEVRASLLLNALAKRSEFSRAPACGVRLCTHGGSKSFFVAFSIQVDEEHGKMCIYFMTEMYLLLFK